MSFIIVIGILLTTRTSQALIEEPEIVNSLTQCDAAIQEIAQENRATIVDDSPFRLYSTWLSQECEVRAGPEYIIRKYTFFKNGTFLLLRYHYAEESCSIATHTVIIRGLMKLLGPSAVVSGATETTFHVDTVSIIPLNRQIVQKFGHKLNVTCGPQPRWRSYVPELIYEQPRQHSATPLWQGPIYNSLQAYSPGKKRLGARCLVPFGIEFSELRLLRVQKRQRAEESAKGTLHYGPRYQLLLASPAPNVRSRWNHKPTSLQSMAMVRADTVNGCPICGSVIRATEFSPPLLHEVAALPALIGGYWHSERCESCQGGIWSKRQFRIHSGDKLWTGRWDYYNDPQCTMFLYAVTATGSYVQRAGRQRRHEEIDEAAFLDYFHGINASQRLFFKRSVTDDPTTTKVITQSDFHRNILFAARESKGRIAAGAQSARKQKRSLNDYQFLYDAQSSMIQSRLAAMLRGTHHQTRDTTTRKPFFNLAAPSGTTELDLHIAESILIPGTMMMSTPCGADRPLINWSTTCIPRAIEAPTTLGLRAKLGVNWNGQYTLLLGSRDDNLWNAPLRQCAQVPPHSSVLRAHLRKSIGLRFGFSLATINRISVWFLFSQMLLWYAYYLPR